jgi:hypothetical protein
VGKRKQTIFKKRWFDITTPDWQILPSLTVSNHQNSSVR